VVESLIEPPARTESPAGLFFGAGGSTFCEKLKRKKEKRGKKRRKGRKRRRRHRVGRLPVHYKLIYNRYFV
jgi:hypothetical protein